MSLFAHHITKHFGPETVLKDLSLEVPEGKTVSLYFGVFGIYSRRNCSVSYLEVINLIHDYIVCKNNPINV